ncbi:MULTISPECIES: hypothetical protein [Kitasatospora]|uniref:hypothetical protein n=1 Tax=Kitasatospora TaxID=2063 RepID=UPI000686EDD3|nr:MULTISPECIES: hypothetical protein [Kitasatospora]
MNPDDLFVMTPSGWGEGTVKRLNRELVNKLRRGPVATHPDADVAYHMVCLIEEDIQSRQPHSQLDDQETADVLRCLDAVLGRLGVAHRLPFRTRRGYWEVDRENGQLGSIADLCEPILTELADHERQMSTAGYRGPNGDLRNVIFAARYKPEIVMTDVAKGIIAITKNAEHCLLYDRAITAEGLTAADLIEWWGRRDENIILDPGARLARLEVRLEESCPNSEPERQLLRVYWQLARSKGFGSVPAILPQVYLHYDPLTQKQRDQEGRRVLDSQVRDFMMFLPGGRRVILEIDGKTHHATTGGRADPRAYAKMARDSRRLTLQGYELYRFGGWEFMDSENPERMLNDFFAELIG